MSIQYENERENRRGNEKKEQAKSFIQLRQKCSMKVNIMDRNAGDYYFVMCLYSCPVYN